MVLVFVKILEQLAASVKALLFSHLCKGTDETSGLLFQCAVITSVPTFLSAT